MAEETFEDAFTALTGNRPFRWQERLFERFMQADDLPAVCHLPTGLGKTSILAIWLLALASGGSKLPRRLVYVVNRRTVVDQATREAEKLRKNLPKVPGLTSKLKARCAADSDCPLAISTLRGEFADNREWRIDPARPAIIVGTVDMIGSRLLFSGYGCGFRSRPLHAGFLGQDVLLVHDEAHLEPAFQTLLDDVRKEQSRRHDLRPLHVIALTATPRSGQKPFGLTQEEKTPNKVRDDTPKALRIVWERLTAKKGIKFPPDVTRDKVASKIGELALRHRESGQAILVFVRRVDDVTTVRAMLTKKKEGVPTDHVQVLTGTLRGMERDLLAKEDRVFARFLPEPQVPPMPGTVYLICTSAGEVGVDISADHLICDLTPLDSMAQRLGRVNRRGGGEAEIDLVYECDADPKKKDDKFEKARWATLKVLRERLPACTWIAGRQEASPYALGEMMSALTEEERRAAFTPTPTNLPSSDILFDAWALTSVCKQLTGSAELPGRPPVADWLHGVAEWEPPETHVAWREEVGVIASELKYKPEDLLEDYPLKPHELLRDRTDRVFKQLEELRERRGDRPVWIVAQDNSVQVTTLENVVGAREEQLNGRTVLLPPSAGGLKDGLLDGSADPAENDVADHWYEDEEHTRHRRQRLWDDEHPQDGMRLVRTLDTRTESEDEEQTEPEADQPSRRFWRWYVRPRSADDDGSKSSLKSVKWQIHTKDVAANAQRLADSLLHDNPELHRALVLAATFHDLGKKRIVWQRSIGNPKPDEWLGKSGAGMKPFEITDYRHELGSLLDLQSEPEFQRQSEDVKDLVRHLIASHHGRARPHFPADEVFDPEKAQTDAEHVAGECPRRFARLQRKYGRWGLAYLESLLRAADYAASANPSEVVS